MEEGPNKGFAHAGAGCAAWHRAAGSVVWPDKSAGGLSTMARCPFNRPLNVGLPVLKAFIAFGVFVVLAQLAAAQMATAKGRALDSTWWVSFCLVYWLCALTAIYARPVRVLRFLKRRAPWAIALWVAAYLLPLGAFVYLTAVARFR